MQPQPTPSPVSIVMDSNESVVPVNLNTSSKLPEGVGGEDLRDLPAPDVSEPATLLILPTPPKPDLEVVDPQMHASSPEREQEPLGSAAADADTIAEITSPEHGDIVVGEASGSLSLRVKLESSIRRFRVPTGISYERLKEVMVRELLEDKTISIQYKDETEERVTIVSEQDMPEFRRIAREHNMDPVHFRINLWGREYSH